MIILHGIWLPDAFFLFGSTEEHQQTDVTEWFDLLAMHLSTAELERGKVGMRSFQLPMIPEKEGHSRQKAGLLLQQVMGISLSIEDALHLLYQSRKHNFNYVNLKFADDFLFWQKVATFAWELMLRGRYHPLLDVVKKGHSYGKSEAIARFEPYLVDPHDRGRLAAFAQSMPPICRSYNPLREKGWIETEPEEILLSFLREAINRVYARWVAPAGQRVLNQKLRQNAPHAITWLNSLGAGFNGFPIQRVTMRSQELIKLCEGVKEWVEHAGEAVSGASSYPFRLFFRMEPPESGAGEGGLWSLRFFLQSLEQPSILLTVEDLRNGNLVQAPLTSSEVAEMLFVQMYQAAAMYPPLKRWFTKRESGEVKLDRMEAYLFLREAADQLREKGYGIQLPAGWFRRQKRRVSLRLMHREEEVPYLGSPQPVHLGIRQLLSFDVELALGDQTMSLTDAQRLSEEEVPLFLVNGEWMELDRDQLRSAYEYAKTHATKQVTLGELLHYTAEDHRLSGLDGLTDIQFTLPSTLRHFLEGKWDVDLYSQDVPELLNGTLRPYQIKGYKWLASMTDLGFGVCLADDMGLGKTIQLIALLVAKRTDQPVLIVCPTSLLTNWQRELERFAPHLTVYVHHGRERLHGEHFSQTAQEHDVVLTSYGLVARDAEDIQQLHWSYLVADESQNMKNYNSKQARSLFMLTADHRIALTGTPVENRLSELWSLFHFLNPGYLGTQQQFRSTFVLPVEREHDEERAHGLHKLVRPFVLRRVKNDPAIQQELPNKIEMKTYCSLSLEQASLYKQTVDAMMQQVEGAEGIQRRGIVLASLTKLKQICDHPALFLSDRSFEVRRSGKLQRLSEIIRDIREQKEAVLIFTQYVEMGNILQRFIAEQLKEEVLFLHGGVPKSSRDKMIDHFQSADGPPVFILSLKAGGVGLNLTRANHVIHFDRWWNPAVENQATDRAFRLGQKKNVHVHTFICKGTLEERIDNLIESKKDLADKIIHAGEKWLTEMSMGELSEILALREDAFMVEEGE